MVKNKQNADSANPVVADISYENALEELEQIISRMESNQLPLEQSLTAYKRGTALLQHCQKTLVEVEQQVRILNESQQLQAYNDNND